MGAKRLCWHFRWSVIIVVAIAQRETDGQADDVIMLIANKPFNCAQYDRLKHFL